MTALSHGFTKSKSASSMYAKRPQAEIEAIEAKQAAAALKKQEREMRTAIISREFNKPIIPQHKIDWSQLVSLDFETYWDADYTLKKMSTSEYVRDPRFKAQMLGLKIGNKKTRIIPADKIRWELLKIDWTTHAVLAHNLQFDGFILSEHYGVHPCFLYDSLAMARGLHSNDIGSGLDEVSVYYGGYGKVEGVLERTKGILNWDKALFADAGKYCGRDVDEMFRIFCAMAPKLPDDEFHLIDIITRMFTSPVLKVDLPRVQKELERELLERKTKMLAAVNPRDWDGVSGILKGKEKELTGEERDMLIIKRVIGSNEKFADLLKKEGLEPPVKISPAWIKDNTKEKYAYAFAKDDIDFLELPERAIETGFDLSNPKDVQKMALKQARVQSLVDVRIAVKSTTNITRAERFLEAGRDGMALPAGYAYSRAHTHRLGGNNKMNMQNLTRGGELRLSILAPAGHQLAVVDSGQIEARVNGWLWGQTELVRAFRTADMYEAQQALLPKEERRNASGNDRDAYCIFGDTVYGREITKADKTERFVGKVCIAEGELVLTDRGLVPINLISKEDRLWDGIEWITHDGVIDQGIREVITYDGLTATPDHEIFTEDGRIISLRQAASEMARLQSTGTEGQSIRFCDDHVVTDTPRKRLSVRVGAMQPERSQETDLPQQPEERQDNLVSQKRAQTGSKCGSAGSPIRCDSRSMQQSGTQALDELRRERDQVLVQDSNGIHPMGVYELTARELQGRGDRQDGQRRALCAREFEVGYTAREYTEPAQHGEDYMVRRASTSGRFPEPVQSDLDLQTGGSARIDGRTNTRKVRVYDIANAGPRFRYTVSGKLVLNCVLGLGFQMGAPKFQITLAKGALGGPPVYFDEAQCKSIVSKYREQNYMIVRGWEICVMIIKDMIEGRTGSHGVLNWEKDRIWLPNGMSLHYPDIRASYNDEGRVQYSYRSGVMRKKIYGGLLCENIVQALARIIVMWQMLQISKKYRCVMTTHDEVVALVKTSQAKTAFAYMMKCMTTSPDWCKDIPLNAEGGYASNYSK